MVRIIAKVDGMMCSMCEAHVNDAVRKAFKVKKVSSSHSKGETEIIAEEPLDVDAVSAAIDATGYKVLSVSSEPHEKKGFFFKK